MSKTKFAPGPWRVDTFRAMGFVVVADCVVAAGMDEHDAHLIAASPILYEELEKIDPNNKALKIARGELMC